MTKKEKFAFRWAFACLAAIAAAFTVSIGFDIDLLPRSELVTFLLGSALGMITVAPVVWVTFWDH